MEPNGSLDPAFWSVFNHRYSHLVYCNIDRAKAYAFSRNSSHEDTAEYFVVSGSQLKIQGIDEVLRSAQYN